MKFGLIRPYQATASIVSVPDLREALRLVHLEPGAVDHGTALPGVGIVVAEHGMFLAPDLQAYFAIAGSLYAGSAVLYGFDAFGLTIDLVELPSITWLQDGDAVEHAIAAGTIKRPHMGMGDDVIWRWPGPQPSEAERQRLMSKVPPGVPLQIDDTIIISESPKGDKGER